MIMLGVGNGKNVTPQAFCYLGFKRIPTIPRLFHLTNIDRVVQLAHA